MNKQARSVTSPMKFFINKGLFNSLNEYTETLGKKPYIIADSFIYERAVDELGELYDDSEIVEFGGENSQSEIDKHKENVKESGADFIIGIGGGKTMDNAKVAAHEADYPVVIFPTLASSDAPATSVSVLYSEEGAFEKYLYLPLNPDIVLVDLDIIAGSPEAAFSAGMADAIATWIEGRVAFETDGENLSENRTSYSGYGIAKFAYETVRQYGVQALNALKTGVVTNALGRTIEATVWMSGVGSEAVGITAAHAIHNGMTSVPDLHDAQHGEKVAFGTIANLILEGAPDEEVFDLANFYKKIELPLTLEDLGLKKFKEDEWRKVAEEACSEDDTMKNMSIKVTPDDVYQAIIAADHVMQLVKDGYEYRV